MTQTDSRRGRFLWVGGHPALDFLNTRWVQTGALTERLQTLDDVLSWLEQADFVTGRQATDLRRRWRGSLRATWTVREARRFRETARRLVVDTGAARRGRPRPAVVAVNALLARGALVPALVREESEWALRSHLRVRHPRDLLAPLARAVVELVVTAPPGRIRRCANPQCVVMFYDDTKSGTRRWCSPRMCGNRARVAAHRRRARSQDPVR